MKILKLGMAALFGVTGLVGCGASPDIDDVQYDADVAVDIGQLRQPLPGSTEPGPTQVLTCEAQTFGGFCELVNGGLHARSVGVLNDTLTSFKVGSDVRVTFCEAIDFGGGCQTFAPGARVTKLGTAAAPELVRNDTASSMRVEFPHPPDCHVSDPPANYIFLYRAANFAPNNDCVAVPIFGQAPARYATAAEIGLQNDTLSSVKIGPSISFVRLYTAANFGGSIDILPSTNRAVPLVPRNDTMSSLEIVR